MLNNKLKLILLISVITSGYLLRSHIVTNKPHTHQTKHLISISDQTPENKSVKISRENLQHVEKPPPEIQSPTLMIAELEGKNANQYGIREDILQYIEANIPIDNEAAKSAAIKIAQYDNQLYYHSISQEEAMKWISKETLALSCLDMALPKNWLTVSEGIGKLMRNTPAREKHMWDIAEKNLSWKILGSGLDADEERKICKSGNY